MTFLNESAGDEDPFPLQAIEQTRLRFEAAWLAGQQPNLREYLGELPDSARDHALCDLLWTEWEQLRRLGTPPSLEEYRQRYAESAEVVDEAWRSDFGRLAAGNEPVQTHGGRYKIEQPHACGGLGQVFVAVDEELERKVALKAIKWPYSNRRAMQERFVREAKITGKLEHPGIVPVYSVGTKSDGTPFYTMRFIHGESLNAAIRTFHANFQQPTAGTPSREVANQAAELPASVSGVAERGNDQNGPHRAPPGCIRREAFVSREFRQLLSRFLFVCDVVEYAHSRGIVHRDIKPSNIMLGQYGETVVIDWGLAKEVGRPEPSESPGNKLSFLTSFSFTTDGTKAGTTAYMSPEQAAGKTGDLSPASDIYSLGATLYHLLVGQAPLADETGDTRLEHIQRGEIPRASALQPAVPKPLAAICAIAMSQDRLDRYESAAALKLELEQWLADEAVTAYAEPRTARFARWARHHPTSVASAAVAILLATASLAGITGLVSFKNQQLTTARSYAEQKRLAAEVEQVRAEKARTEAEAERDQSQAIADFLVNCFRSPDPELDGSAVTVAEILDRSYQDLRDNTKVAVRTKIRLLEALVESALGLGLYSRAVPIAEYAWEFSQEQLPLDDEQRLAIQSTLAAAYMHDSQIAKSASNYDELVKRSRERLGAEHRMTLHRQCGYATVLNQAGRLEEALSLGQETLDAARRHLGAEDSITVNCEYALAVILKDKGRYEEAIAMYRKVLAQRLRDHGPDHPETLMSQNALADALEKAGHYAEAVSLQEATLNQRKTKLGPEHPFTLNSQSNLAMVYQSIGRFDEAIALHKKTLESRERVLGPRHTSTLRSMNNLATAHSRKGESHVAILLLRQSLKARSEVMGLMHIDTLRTECNLAAVLSEAGECKEALELIETNLAKSLQTLGSSHPHVLRTRSTRAKVLRAIRRPADAIAILEDVLPAITTLLGKGHPETLDVQNSLATALAETGNLKKAALWYHKTAEQQAASLGLNHPHTLLTYVNLGVCLHRLGASQESLKSLQLTSKRTVDRLGWNDPLTLQCHLALAVSYDACGRNAAATDTYETMIVQLQQAFGPTHLCTATAERHYAGYLFKQGVSSQAVLRLEHALATIHGQLGRTDALTRETTRELATILRLMQRFSDAESRYRELVDVAMTKDRHDDVTQANDLYWLGWCQVKNGKYLDAEVCIRECLAIRERIAPDDWTTMLARNFLGQVLVGQKKFTDAEHYLISGYKGLEVSSNTIPQTSRERIIRESLERIVLLYDSWERPEDGTLWRTKLSEHSANSRAMSDK